MQKCYHVGSKCCRRTACFNIYSIADEFLGGYINTRVVVKTTPQLLLVGGRFKHDDNAAATEDKLNLTIERLQFVAASVERQSLTKPSGLGFVSTNNTNNYTNNSNTGTTSTSSDVGVLGGNRDIVVTSCSNNNGNENALPGDTKTMTNDDIQNYYDASVMILKERVSYCFAKNDKCLIWALATWCTKISGSHISLFGTESDKDILPIERI